MSETVVRIIKNWTWPDLARQTPGGTGRWNGVRFELGGDGPCDYGVVLNQAPPGTMITCPPEHVWLLLQEPPNDHFRAMHRGSTVHSRVFTTDTSLEGARYVQTHPALPWHVDRDYDWLKGCAPPEKTRAVSCITSAKAIFEGHRRRLRFLADVRRQVPFDLFGRGFASVSDKWDVLAPYRFALVVENFANPLYWSEKLADPLLAWTVPIYAGCTNITRWFPEDAIIQVDMADPDAADKIEAAVNDERGWKRRMDAVAEARRRILDEYNMFAVITQNIAKDNQPASAARPIRLSDRAAA
jgi:hypothetical protein